MLEVIYEGIPAGNKNVDQIELQDANALMEPGRICCLTAGGTGSINTVYLGGITPLVSTLDFPFGLVADSKADDIVSGKVTVYFTQGLYRTDQLSGTINKGDVLSFDDMGMIKTAITGDYVVGYCTETMGGDGAIEMVLNITGAKAS